MSLCNVLPAIINTIMGGMLSLLASWWIAKKYFERQRKIDSLKEHKEVELAHSRLMNAFFKMYGKRSKEHPSIREAMTEFEAKLKIYRPEYDATKMMEDIGKQAKDFIKNNPDNFEDDI